MADPTIDTKTAATQIHQIEEAEKRLQAQLKSIQQQLQSLDQHSVPDSHPWLTFKRVNSIQELKSLHPSLRSALRQDIVELREKLGQLQSELQAARRQSALARLQASQSAAVQHFHDVEVKLAELLKKWKSTGTQPEAELEQLLGVAEKVMDEQISTLKSNPSHENMRSVLKSMKTLSLFGKDPDKAWSALSSAAERRLSTSIDKLRISPTKANVAEVLNRGREACLMGSDAAGDKSIRAALDGAIKIRESAERQFRSVPSVANFQALFKAQHDQTLLGEDVSPDHPQGLRDAPRGTTHTVRPGDTLSQLSKMYFGSAGYWDVIVWRNVGMIHDFNAPPVGRKLIIA
jgi:hypothetical protein